MTDVDSEGETEFAIDSRPRRRYPRAGGVEYEGETVFALAPTPERSNGELQRLLEDVLAGESYTYGDWFDLPMALYLVHDERTGDVFRVAIRDGRVQLHVLPATESAGLRRLYDRLRDSGEVEEWAVERQTEPP